MKKILTVIVIMFLVTGLGFGIDTFQSYVSDLESEALLDILTGEYGLCGFVNEALFTVVPVTPLIMTYMVTPDFDNVTSKELQNLTDSNRLLFNLMNLDYFYFILINPTDELLFLDLSSIKMFGAWVTIPDMEVKERNDFVFAKPYESQYAVLVTLDCLGNSFNEGVSIPVEIAGQTFNPLKSEIFQKTH